MKFNELSNLNFEIKNIFQWSIKFSCATSATGVKVSKNFVGNPKNISRKMKKVANVVLLYLIVLISDVELSEISNHDNTTKVEVTIGHVKQLNGSANATLDQNTPYDTTTQSILTTSTEVTPTTADPEQLLIPPATVAAQIVNADVSTKKPSRLAAAA